MSSAAIPATCERCGASFDVSSDLASRYPGWVPSLCPRCYRSEDGAGSPRAATERRSEGRRAKGGRGRGATLKEENLTTAEVLARYTEGPRTGVFTDGSAIPNPGPGGWGAVYVVDDDIVAQAHGHDPDTTNNRMEFTAVIRAAELVPEGTATPVYTDSRLVHDTLTSWAAGWEARGWKRKTGAVQNLDLVKEAYAIYTSRPELELAWVPAHAGYRWNEYADSLSTAWMRDEI